MADDLQKQFRRTGRWMVLVVIILVGVGETLLGRAMFRKELPSAQELKQQEAANYAKQQVWASDVKSAMLVREESERTRYREIYKIDFSSTSVYDLVLDSRTESAEALAEKVAAEVKRHG